MPITTDELLADLPDAIKLYGVIKAAIAAIPAGQPTTAVTVGNVLVAVTPDVCALIDKLVAQAKS